MEHTQMDDLMALQISSPLELAELWQSTACFRCPISTRASRYCRSTRHIRKRSDLPEATIRDSGQMYSAGCSWSVDAHVRLNARRRTRSMRRFDSPQTRFDHYRATSCMASSGQDCASMG